MRGTNACEISDRPQTKSYHGVAHCTSLCRKAHYAPQQITCDLENLCACSVPGVRPRWEPLILGNPPSPILGPLLTSSLPISSSLLLSPALFSLQLNLPSHSWALLSLGLSLQLHHDCPQHCLFIMSSHSGHYDQPFRLFPPLTPSIAGDADKAVGSGWVFILREGRKSICYRCTFYILHFPKLDFSDASLRLIVWPIIVIIMK